MGNIVIRVQDLGKKYDIRRFRKSKADRNTLRQNPKDTVWALQNINLDIKQGQVLGIIGRNGAGKSTLLKLISRLTLPTSGKIYISGRIGSLLEVGTGFHPDLTGRENIYLNGAILGMQRKAIEQRFDQIITFSEIERYIDTPVKHYSSGMYMRLAFSVAAHLDSEILLVDEVLAVGDIGFQRKCMEKINSLAKMGQTILFVSHNVVSVQRLCDSAIILERGHLVFQGDVPQAIKLYMEDFDRVPELLLAERTDRQGEGRLRFTDVKLFDQANQLTQKVVSGQQIRIRFYYESAEIQEQASVLIAFNIYDEQGVLLTNLNTSDVARINLPVGYSGYFECSWDKLNLRPGTYNCALFCEVNGVIQDWIQSAFYINVEAGDFYGIGQVSAGVQGSILIEYDWSSQVNTPAVPVTQ